MLVRAQNAGLIISEDTGNLIFEAFELCPLNESVMSTPGRLKRSFPGCAFTLKRSAFEEEGFREVLAQMVAKMSCQPIPDAQPKVKKAGQFIDETRDTTHPKAVTELLMGIISANGSPAEVSFISKNTRDEVMWKHCILPWRRSAMWMLARVVMQLGFSRLSAVSHHIGSLYKEFMVYFLASALDLSHEHAHVLGNDMLLAMSAKISKRITKLSIAEPYAWIAKVQGTLAKTRNIAEARWRDVNAKEARTSSILSGIKKLDFTKDTRIQLPELDGFLFPITQTRVDSLSSKPIQLSALSTYSGDELPVFQATTPGKYQIFEMVAFEKWVEYHLSAWILRHGHEYGNGSRLRELIETYHGSASTCYADNPEALSIMILTVLELWVAIDQGACRCSELLSDYDTEIPFELLQSLVLPLRSHLQRLSNVEHYLAMRWKSSDRACPSIFRAFGEPSSFSVRYFDKSRAHQELLERIENKAFREADDKRQELARKKHEYRSQMKRWDEGLCETEPVRTSASNNRTLRQHKSNCKRCQYKRSADHIEIEIHEWPLPDNRLKAKSTVFELNIPAWFGAWRDASWFILYNVLGLRYRKEIPPRYRCELNGDPGLHHFFKNERVDVPRLRLLSDVKPHVVTHRRLWAVKDVSSECDVCLRNGLRYWYFDQKRNCFAGDFVTTSHISELCTYKLPERSSSLQTFLERTVSMPSGPPPNEVIANLSDCPPHFSLEEYKVFCSVPLGYRIQWMNILADLAAPSLDYAKAETTTMILQTIYQAGPPAEGDIRRVSHLILADETFGHALLAQIERSQDSMRANWESMQALATFTHLEARILSFAPSPAIESEALVSLAQARKIALAWMLALQEKAQHTIDANLRANYSSKAVDAALICINTFNVGEHLSRILSEPEAAMTFLQCSINIQECSLSSARKDGSAGMMFLRWNRLSHQAIPRYVKMIVQERSQCLHNAVRSCWFGYRGENAWQTFAAPLEHWLSTTTIHEESQEPLSVHFNLLTAELLVDGHPLSRLPGDYEKHPTYYTLFGGSKLEVVPTSAGRMRFSARNLWLGHTVHFGMQLRSKQVEGASSDLLIVTEKNGLRYELIPSRVFQDNFPQAFVDQYVHWFDHLNGSVEFRLLKSPWISCPESCRLVKSGSSWRLAREDAVLINTQSPTARACSALLIPLEVPSHIQLFFNNSCNLLILELPRLRLTFTVESGSSIVRCKEFHGTSIDDSQEIGTLVGLSNKLILKQNQGEHRIALIPEGQASFEKEGHGMKVWITSQDVAKVYAYRVDERLGRILDDGDLQSKLFLCYLHALTSSCLPDPLTGRTGTEQALDLLNSAAVRSFDYLTKSNVQILESIAKLVPPRAYYPESAKLMQTVDWNPNLSFIYQHSGLHKAVDAIFEQSRNAQMFYPETYTKPPVLRSVHPDLLLRDLIRSSSFHVFGYGAEEFTTHHDAKYSARDRGQNSPSAVKAFLAASWIARKHTALHAKPRGLKDFLLLNFESCDIVPGPTAPLENSQLKYDACLLEQPFESLALAWCSFHETIRLSPLTQLYSKSLVMIWLAAIAFAKNSDLQILQIIALLFNVAHFAPVGPPRVDFFVLRRGIDANLAELEDLIRVACKDLSQFPAANPIPNTHESIKEYNKRKHLAVEGILGPAARKFATALVSQWPCDTPNTPPEASQSPYIDTNAAMRKIRPKFKAWFENHRFFSYLKELEKAIYSQEVIPLQIPVYSAPLGYSDSQRLKRYVESNDIFSVPVSFTLPVPPSSPDVRHWTVAEQGTPSSQLDTLMAHLEASAQFEHERKYLEDLRTSLKSLQNHPKRNLRISSGFDISLTLKTYQSDCIAHTEKLYSILVECFGYATLRYHSYQAAAITGRCARICPTLFLKQLSRKYWQELPPIWKEGIVAYAISLTQTQRAQRLVRLSPSSNELIAELLDPGHQNWDPFKYEYSENLLLEVESEITIRKVQESIASQMRSPPSNRNYSMQLNMGEGKSSVIVPIVSAALADTTKLVRVIVGKPQSKQMFQMLVSKLGGILNRRIYHLPFSRALKPGRSDAEEIGRICRECMENAGVLLVQPEHILSFQLMGLECLITGDPEVGRTLIDIQHFFNTKSRDIVDESDENFSVKFELVYTMGTQRPIELTPARWILIQKILEFVIDIAVEVKLQLPDSIEVDDRWPERTPRIRVLRSDALDLLLESLGKRICDVGLPGLLVPRWPEETRLAVLNYITKNKLTDEQISLVEHSTVVWTHPTNDLLLLARGLIAGGVLGFALGSKRWRVNYGIDTKRQPKTELVVPFRVKDNPTLRSEFSHPDVVIILTMLSYYYGGLTDDALFLALSHLLKSDQSKMEYSEWVRTSPELPDAFHDLVGVNIKDHVHCVEQLFPNIRYSKGAVDYYLSHLVFPKLMKEFPFKLSASGWDIGCVKAHPTTAFSGTNDSRHLLPLSVDYLHLEEQKHTNSLVLKYLLQEENSVTLLPSRTKTRSSDAELLLRMLVKIEPVVRVILDVGAQVIELSNQQVAEAWLELTSDDKKTEAVVFFNDTDELEVIDRRGRIEPLQTSHYAKQLDLCLVFLDEAHTRGTDLRLPGDYRAAVTLGANLTKDRLIQCCMRMRKLGQGQSIVFCVPEEIKIKILARMSKPDCSPVEVVDVLCWAISETCIDLQRSMALWAAQGRRFESQKLLWEQTKTNDVLTMTATQAEAFLEQESQSLADRYHPRTSGEKSAFSGWDSSNGNIMRIIQRCQEFGSLDFDSAIFQEEQERELAPEVEEERQVENPARATANHHDIHPKVELLARTGQLYRFSSGFMPAFQSLRGSSAAKYLDVGYFPSDLLVTSDFAHTIMSRGKDHISDSYQRRVQWVVTTNGAGSSKNILGMVIISPYEAQQLLPLIREHNKVTLHLYAARPGASFQPLDQLNFFTQGKVFHHDSIPRTFIIQLNLFAGQLYLSSFTEYVELCDSLGLAWKATDGSMVVNADGFIVSNTQGSFRQSPVGFLKVLMSKIRRNGEDIDKTHLGRILNGELLTERDFENEKS